VNKVLESQRNAGVIGSALEADVKLYCSEELKATLDKLEDEMRFVLITSSCEVLVADPHADNLVVTDVDGLWVTVKPLTFAKCERCWHRREEVGQLTQHPTLCSRCVENIDGSGEVRKFA
jgi:isoleucyl-tRNA synthetase